MRIYNQKGDVVVDDIADHDDDGRHGHICPAVGIPSPEVAIDLGHGGPVEAISGGDVGTRHREAVYWHRHEGA